MSQTFRDTFATIRDIRDNSRHIRDNSRQFATNSRQFATNSRQYVTNCSFHVSRQVLKKIWRQMRSLTKLVPLFSHRATILFKSYVFKLFCLYVHLFVFVRQLM